MTLATILGAIGAMLVLVSLVGGGFTFSGSVMPKVGKVSRVLCFAVGSAMVLFAIGVWATDSLGPPPGPAPAAQTTSAEPSDPPPSNPPAETSIGYVMVPAGYTAYVFEEPYTDSAVVTELENGTGVEIVCTAEGEPVTSPLTGTTSTLWNGTMDGGFIPDVFVDTGTDQPVQPNCLDFAS